MPAPANQVAGATSLDRAPKGHAEHYFVSSKNG